jgi:release factor glutamine methyltransferase
MRISSSAMEHEFTTPAESIAAALAAATARVGGDEARADAELLLAHLVGRPRSWLYAHGEEPVSPELASRYAALLQRRAAGEPVAYLIGRREFWSLELEVSPATLVPRPETELLVELALDRLSPGGAERVIDLGTGSGAIALAIARERPRVQVTAVDASAAALEVAQRNAARLGLARVRFLRSDWFSAVRDESFDLVVSNPPYLASDDPHLREGSLPFEPALALASGHDGFDALRTICAGSPAHLRAGGWLLFEHGLEQGEPARSLLAASGFAQVHTWRDLEGRERVSGGMRPG